MRRRRRTLQTTKVQSVALTACFGKLSSPPCETLEKRSTMKSDRDGVILRIARKKVVNKMTLNEKSTAVPITVTNDTAASLQLGVMLRADETFSDVRLVVGKEKTVLTAHAVVLASTSDYYKEALSPKWVQASEAGPIERIDTTDESAKIDGGSKRSDADSKRSDERAERSDRRTHRKFLRTSQVAPTQSKPTLNHPDVDVATVSLVVDYMYTGTAQIPPSLIFSVITFADEILVPGLVTKCAQALVDGRFITSENALEFYVLCEDIQSLRKYRSFALDVVLEDIFPSLESGREFLVQMDKEEVEMLLLFDHFSPLDRWKILIAWCKAHLSSDIGLDVLDDVPDEISDDVARELIEPLLPAVDLFQIEREDLKYVGYYRFWLPEVVEDLLEFRRNGTTPAGVNKWKPEQRPYITNQEIKRILVAIKCHLPLRLRSNGARPSSNLLFQAEPAGFSNEQFHAACDDKMNTLTVIRIKNGCIIGGFIDEPWISGDGYLACETAFLFIMAPNGTVRILPCKNKEEAIFSHRNGGPTFGNQDLMVHKTQVTAFLERYEAFGSFEDGETCCFVESLYNGAVGVGVFEDCKVFQILA